MSRTTSSSGTSALMSVKGTIDFANAEPSGLSMGSDLFTGKPSTHARATTRPLASRLSRFLRPRALYPRATMKAVNLRTALSVT